MADTLRVKKLRYVQTSDDLKKAGDYYLVDNLHTTNEKEKKYPAIIMKCPYCGMDMASRSMHRIEYKKNLWERYWGYEGKITIKPMLQCPYTPTHKFEIKRGKILSL